MAYEESQDTSRVGEWRSIVTLVVFVLTNVNVLFPFHIPIFVPRKLSNLFLDALAAIRIIPKRQRNAPPPRPPGVKSDASTNVAQGADVPVDTDDDDDNNGKIKPYVRLNFPMNFVTAPLIADLFLLAIQAIGRQEVHDGTIGADNISPIDIMAFFITLAYIAISIDASGLIRYLAFKVLQWGGKVGHRLFFCLYAFFFVLGSFIGNDPIILSGTAFLAYMTRVSSNIVHPRAWIHTQFAIANIASAILVSSNPTNLVLAGAFNIKFINYTANMIVPVVATAVILFPFLLYIVFADESLIPYSINMHELPDEVKDKKPVNPNIPHARGHVEEDESDLANNEQGKLLSLEEIMNPFLDKGGAAFGAVIMAATLITVLALNAASTKDGPHPVFWVTLPAAFVMFCWDLGFGWYHRAETREIARKGRQDVETARAERAIRLQHERRMSTASGGQAFEMSSRTSNAQTRKGSGQDAPEGVLPHPPTPAILVSEGTGDEKDLMPSQTDTLACSQVTSTSDMAKQDPALTSDLSSFEEKNRQDIKPVAQGVFLPSSPSDGTDQIPDRHIPDVALPPPHRGPTTLVSLGEDALRWSQETFPTAAAVALHLPFALVPFAFCMFVLVQGLVTKGWVPVFAHGWDHWVNKTGTVGSIAGMGFLSVVLCNFAGTNIGTTILLSRVIQSWQAIHKATGEPISDRTFWATVYSMAIGVNYGAFSTAFSASLAGLLWRDILARKHIRVRSLDFARVNLPIITIAMIVGCVVLVGQIYITRGEGPYDA
ncbi:arsenite efflux transporter ArsB-like [Purpureocillium lilacinum]|uniref:Arsenite efflux transporter ArsB-like n=1 Tax=Purpureocillium lilacinum TaxID=33203 RepID=A0A179HVT7_PURLI|nr:arsenite efflux transporter ArsB-like [Purpureocillium lilacinum]OAQ94002.1 arsenite efflux transporter ArsB-like [Purpureocillium lilacinum]